MGTRRKSKVSKSCETFISSLLEDNICSRLTAEKALAHEWIAGNNASTKELSSFYLDGLKKYQHQSHLQKILIHSILDEISPADERLLHEELLRENKFTSTE